MRLFHIAVLVFLASFLGVSVLGGAHPSSAASVSEATTIGAHSVDEIGLRTFNRTLDSSRDPAVVMSPYSIQSALGMLALGSRGATAKVFRQQGLGGDNRARRVIRSLAKGSNADAVLRVANSAWIRPQARPRPKFVRALRRDFNARMTTINFSRPEATDRINAWVSSATQKMIPRVVDRLETTTEFALINTVYFKGKWSQPFEKNGTKPAPFTRLDGTKHEVPMMNARSSLLYADAPTWHAVALPYKGDRLQMIVATSKDPAGSTDFKRTASSSGFIQSLAQLKMQETDVGLAMPRFKAEYGADLTPNLQDLGLKQAFGPGADYHRITKASVRSISVLHRTVVDVTEEGSEAAAATTVIATRAIREPSTKQFSADRPFLFAITDKVTGTILFVGFVSDPAA
jgi:serine protease inhibitor